MRIQIAGAVTALALAGCMSAAPVESPGTTPTSATVSTASATTMGAALNAARAQNGLRPVVPNGKLMAAAQVQANHMASTGNLTHTGPRGSSVGQRVRAAGCSYSWVGENVAMGQSSDQQTMDLWMTSPGHRSNALNRAATSYGSAQVGGYRALVLAGGC